MWKKQFVLDELLHPGVVTAMHLTSSSFYAPHGSVTAHTWIDRGFGVARMPLAFWATVCKTVRPMLSVRCLSVCV